MLKLYQREDCPHCHQIRRFLENNGIAYEAVPVAKLGSARTDVLALRGVTSPEVPVLADGDDVVQGTERILAHLEKKHRKNVFGDPRYGLTRRLPGVAFADAVGAVTEALKTEGFGVLTEIDVKATLKKKIDVDFRNYVILGACNPPLAHQALVAEPAIGLLLPCNVVVTEEDDGSAVVSAVDPVSMFEIVDRPDVRTLAEEVRDRLRRVMAALAGG